MAGGAVLERIDAILDEVEDKLRTDNRMPQGSDSSALSIDELNIRRGERTEANINQNLYPMCYIIHGEVSESDATTRDNEFVFTIWLEHYVRDRDMEIAVDRIKKYVTQSRRIFRETADDKRMVTNGSALALNTQTPSFDWGQFRPVGNQDEWEIGGLVQLEFTFHLPD